MASKYRNVPCAGNIYVVYLSPPIKGHAGPEEVDEFRTESLMHVLIVEILATSKSERHYEFAWNDELI